MARKRTNIEVLRARIWDAPVFHVEDTAENAERNAVVLTEWLVKNICQSLAARDTSYYAKLEFAHMYMRNKIEN